MLQPNYTLKDIQLSFDGKEFDKGMKLFKDDKVGAIKETYSGFGAIVSGTEKYTVEVESNNFENGDCNCYLGQNNYLCKHILALAIATVHKHSPQDVAVIDHTLTQAVCSGKVKEITTQELSDVEGEIKAGLSHIKSWSGTSKK